MANSYTHFSEELELKNEEEVKWMKERFAERRRSFEGAHGAVTLLEGEEAEALSCCESMADFEIDFSGNLVTFFAEESGNLDDVASLVQEYLQKFDLARCWAIAEAHGCSKPRAGEFGGAACFVTADGIRWMSTSGWVHVQATAWNTCKSCRGPRTDHAPGGKCLFEPTTFVKSDPDE